MALKKCEDCKEEISSAARSCVHCGCPMYQSVFSMNLGADGVILRIMIAIGLILVISNVFNRNGLETVGFILMFAGTLLLFIRSLR